MIIMFYSAHVVVYIGHVIILWKSPPLGGTFYLYLLHETENYFRSWLVERRRYYNQFWKEITLRTDTWIYNLCDASTSENGRLDKFCIVKRNSVSPVIDNEFCHNIVKVVCGSTRLSPRRSTATLTISTTRRMKNWRRSVKGRKCNLPIEVETSVSG